MTLSAPRLLALASLLAPLAVGACAVDDTGAQSGNVQELDDATLCERTGGAWEAEGCACVQDGASLHYEFFAGLGCAPPPVEPLTDMFGTGPLPTGIVHPELGLYFIHRPGAVDAVAQYDDLATLAGEFPWAAELVGAHSCEVAQGLPTFSCDSETADGFSAEGCFYEGVLDYDRVSVLMTTLNEYDFTDFTPEEIDAARDVEALARGQIVVTAQGASFTFGRVDGAWYLLVLDAARYDCSA